MSEDRHPYPRVESRICGVLWVYQAVCECGWKGPEREDLDCRVLVANEKDYFGLEARAERDAGHDGYMHYERNKPLSLDDIGWLTGTGAYAQ
jgi:hypothetical protein